MGDAAPGVAGVFGAYQTVRQDDADMDSTVNNKSITVSLSSHVRPQLTFLSGTISLLQSGPLNLFILFVPFAFVSKYAEWPDGLTFTLSILALAPLAERLGFVTEQLTIHTNDSIGGLLNATFGNATELIVALMALYRGLFRLVQLSMLGSILSNILLVLGSSFFLGGCKYQQQTFSKISSQMNATLLILSCMAILGPTIMTMSRTESKLEEVGYSRATSVILFVMYFFFLYFQVRTFVHSFSICLSICLISCLIV
jgi:Ca2+:H+ antiporter